MQESIFGGVEESYPPSGGMPDCQGAATDQEVGMTKNDKLVFVVGTLRGTDQYALRK